MSFYLNNFITIRLDCKIIEIIKKYSEECIFIKLQFITDVLFF